MQRPDSPILPREGAPNMRTPYNSQVSNSETCSSVANQSNQESFRASLDIDEEIRARGNAFARRILGVDYHFHLHTEAKRDQKKYALDSRSTPRNSRMPRTTNANQGYTATMDPEPLRLVPDTDSNAFPSTRQSQETTKDVRLQGVIHPEMDPEATYSTIDLRDKATKKPALITKKSVKLIKEMFRRNRGLTSETVIQPKAMQILGEDEDFTRNPESPPKLGREAIRAIAASGRGPIADRSHYDFKVSGLDYSCQGLPPSSYAPSNESIQSCVDLSTPQASPPLGVRTYTDSVVRPKLKKAKSLTKLASVIGVRSKSNYFSTMI
jgi:hypothetical protein